MRKPVRSPTRFLIHGMGDWSVRPWFGSSVWEIGFDKLTPTGHGNPRQGLKQSPYSILRTHLPSDHDNAELLLGVFPD
jgi:hypothetical protein